MADGRLVGVEIAASSGGEYLGHERFRDFWAAAEETGALVFVHPTTNAVRAADLAGALPLQPVGNPVETAVAAAHMVLRRRAGRASRA